MKNRAQLRPRNLKTSEQVHRKTRAALLKSAPTPPKRILVPIDFSQGSNEALDYALSFAKQFRARVILMHVVEAFPIDYLLGLKEAETANQWLIEQSRERLGEVAKRLTRASLGRVEAVVTFGKPFQQIAEAAQARAVDLIILATHGYTGLKYIQLGSTAERLLRHTPCPVLVVREKTNSSASAQSASTTKTKEAGARFKVQRILVPVDFSSRSAKALQYALPIARRFRASIALLHVVQANYFHTSNECALFDYPALISEMQRCAKKQLETFAGSINRRCRVTATMKTGHPSSLIVETSSKLNIDLIIISTHGRAGIHRALLGSTAEFVVRHAHCPVLAVRERERALPSAKIPSRKKT